MKRTAKQKKAKAPRGEPVTKSPALAIWKMMVQRCRNPRYVGTKNYGVPVCERWLGAEGFGNFLADVGPQPAPGVGLRRRDSSIGFEPGNVEWGPTRGTILTHDGRSMSQAEWAREMNINPSTLRARRRKGWSEESMLTREVRRQFPYYGTWGEHNARMRKKLESSPR